MTVTSAGPSAVGAALDRKDGPLKVRGAATYAGEWPVDNPAYLYPLQATIAAGRITGVDASAALDLPGVLGVITHVNAPKLAWATDPEVAVLQSDEVAWRGQIVGAVVAETLETARHAAGLVRLAYEQRPHDTELRADRHDLHRPQHAALFGAAPGDLQDGSPADSALGDVDAGLAEAAFTLDATYTTPMNHHNPMEPHTGIAVWTDDEITLYCSSQGVHLHRSLLAGAFGVDAARIRAISPHVGGGFGSKVYPVVWGTLALMGAQLVPGRPVKFALTRQQMFALVGYRPATIQRVRLGADSDGRLTAIAHDVIQQTARAKEYAEQTVGATRAMYAAPNRSTTTRVAALDVPVPTIMRGPGEATGMFALESAMDEMASAAGLDPIEFRIRNEPAVHPEHGLPFSTRNLVACLREGARRFGWEGRDPAPLSRRENDWLVGTGVASSIYPSPRLPGNSASIHADADGRYTVRIGAADIGTGTWTALTQIAAEALGVGVEDVNLEIGDTSLPVASSAGFSSGINCWGSTIYAAADELRKLLDSEHGGMVPAEGIEASADMPDNPYMEQFAMYSFGAQFAEVRVHEDTGEIRVPRLLGVFDAGRIINPKTARSQLIGGMTQGLSMALHEASVIDPRFGHVVNNDLGGYHFASNADVGSVEVHYLEERDPYTNPMGSKGIGEVCIVGTAAAIANAVHHATGVRVRDLPITLDKLIV
ncbi:xanthine dehydrogenase [Planotetraspora thailandica]|uniref:Xanthine dehydrogenase n=1 Tax=Planotetraspora thailandica TaxID=487172 RepID=A0A8J3XUJ8_9ACTN|nr:xanthine dehydrogenase family protein molybdopterin-binding subunit [Planotetraspora thailandica]GII53359.1 xanthine dehydrogenase [Planotetraspora thailandica]